MPDAQLAALRRAGASYIFAGSAGRLDVGTILDKLAALFGVRRLLVEGGGGINGTFLRAGAVDEISGKVLRDQLPDVPKDDVRSRSR